MLTCELGSNSSMVSGKKEQEEAYRRQKEKEAEELRCRGDGITCRCSASSRRLILSISWDRLDPRRIIHIDAIEEEEEEEEDCMAAL